MHATTSPRVLIVGAGPAGLFAAGELARHGVAARLVERQPTPHQEARATVLQPAILEVLGRAGALDRFLEVGMPIRRVRIAGPGFAPIALATLAGIDCPYEYQLALPQWLTERLLTAHLEALGGTVERGVEVLAIEDGPDALAVTLRHADGTDEQVAVDHLLGAGGAHSITRQSMQGRLEGETYGGQFIAADVRAGLAGEPEESRLFLGPDGLLMLAPLPDERFIMFVSVDAAVTAPPDEAELAALVDQRLGRAAGIHDVRWSSRFRMHKRLSSRLAGPRRFLLGDAGHLSSPIAGEGLNSALLDAADIAWKLALVLHGAARPTLLDSYAIERSLADHHVLDVSDATHRNVMDMVAVLAAGGLPVPAVPDPVRDLAFQQSRAMLDISYAGSPLVGEHGAGEGASPRPGARFPERSRLSGTGHHLLAFGPAELDPLRDRWSGQLAIIDGAVAGFDAARAGVPDGGLVLVRPDGMIGFRAGAADAAGMAALDAHLASYLVPGDAGMAGPGSADRAIRL